MNLWDHSRACKLVNLHSKLLICNGNHCNLSIFSWLHKLSCGYHLVLDFHPEVTRDYAVPLMVLSQGMVLPHPRILSWWSLWLQKCCVGCLVFCIFYCIPCTLVPQGARVLTLLSHVNTVVLNFLGFDCCNVPDDRTCTAVASEKLVGNQPTWAAAGHMCRSSGREWFSESKCSDCEAEPHGFHPWRPDAAPCCIHARRPCCKNGFIWRRSLQSTQVQSGTSSWRRLALSHASSLRGLPLLQVRVHGSQWCNCRSISEWRSSAHYRFWN